MYGYGFAGERVGGVDVWGHPGSFGGFQSSFLLVPSLGAVFVGLTNSGHGKRALREVEDAFFERAVGARRRVAPTVDVPRADLERLAGAYENSGLRATVTVDAPALAVEAVEFDVATREAFAGHRSRTRDPPARVRDRRRRLRRRPLRLPLPGFARFGSRLAERVA